MMKGSTYKKFAKRPTKAERKGDYAKRVRVALKKEAV
jgi:hypothetical protein